MLHLRNIGLARSPPIHSNAEILPPIEGLSVSLNPPTLRLTGASAVIFCTFDVWAIHGSETSLGINPDQALRGDSRGRYLMPRGWGGFMSRRIKEFVDIADNVALDELIQKLVDLRDGLPANPEAELRLRGDDIFGHRITITYFRDQTEEEAECERRYAEAEKEAKERELARLQAELGVVCYAAPGKRGKLRIVA
jgi:hypothetical protein